MCTASMSINEAPFMISQDGFISLMRHEFPVLQTNETPMQDDVEDVLIPGSDVGTVRQRYVYIPAQKDVENYTLIGAAGSGCGCLGFVTLMATMMWCPLKAGADFVLAVSSGIIEIVGNTACYYADEELSRNITVIKFEESFWDSSQALVADKDRLQQIDNLFQRIFDKNLDLSPTEDGYLHLRIAVLYNKIKLLMLEFTQNGSTEFDYKQWAIRLIKHMTYGLYLSHILRSDCQEGYRPFVIRNIGAVKAALGAYFNERLSFVNEHRDLVLNERRTML